MQMQKQSLNFEADKAYDTKEVAAAIGVSRSTLARWRADHINGGEYVGPPYLKLGNQVVFRGSDLNAWLAACRVTASEAA